MASMTRQWIKKSASSAKPKALAPGASPADFTMVDNGSDVCSVTGLDAAGSPVTLPSTYSLTVTSDTPAVCSVGSISGMTYKETAASAGVANITVTATDSATPPGATLTITYQDTITSGGPTGLVISHGPVTINTAP